MAAYEKGGPREPGTSQAGFTGPLALGLSFKDYSCRAGHRENQGDESSFWGVLPCMWESEEKVDRPGPQDAGQLLLFPTEWQKNGVNRPDRLCLDPGENFVGSGKTMRKEGGKGGSSGQNGSVDVTSVLAVKARGLNVLAAVRHTGCRTAQTLVSPQEA